MGHTHASTTKQVDNYSGRHTHTHARTHAHTHTHIYTHTHIHTQTHTHTHPRPHTHTHAHWYYSAADAVLTDFGLVGSGPDLGHICSESSALWLQSAIPPLQDSPGLCHLP